MTTPWKILVTGEPVDDADRFPREAGGRELEWTRLPVLRFERLPVAPELMRTVVEKPFGWVILASPRAVRFWTETLLEHQVDFPLETQVACLGEKTADAAADDGFTPDFYPTEPGTETFLAEFEDLLAQRAEKPSILMPVAEGGRPTIRERLVELGCEVTVVPLYRTLPVEERPAAAVAGHDALVFTSPSSVDAFLRHFEIPSGVRVVSLGRYTGEHLVRRGVAGARLLPHGDFRRIGDVL